MAKAMAANLNRPNLNRPNLNRPNLNRPNLNRPNLNRPNLDKQREYGEFMAALCLNPRRMRAFGWGY